MTVKKIILADDHQLILDGLVKILSTLPGIEIVATANTGTDALKYLGLLKADLVITDVEMPGMNGIELLKAIRKQYPGVKVMMLTMYKEPALAREIMNLDTEGYILQTADQNEMLTAVSMILNGKKYFSPELTMNLVNTEIKADPDKQLLAELTQREIEILTLIAQGFSNKQIAEKLFISPKTVDTHRTNMMNKLNIHNVAGITRFAIQNNLM